MEDIIQTEQTLTPEEQAATGKIPEPKGRKYIWLIVLCTVLIGAVVAFLSTGKLRKYDQAEKLYDQKDYAAAAQIFEELADYKDASARTKEVRYAQALAWMGQEQYDQALEAFEELEDYKAARYQLQQCHFLLGEAAMEEGAFDRAEEHFTNAQSTGTAPQRKLDAIYARGHELYLDGEQDAAQTYFDRLEGQWPQNGGPHFETLEDALDYIRSLAENLPESVTVVIKDMPGSYILRPDYLNATVQQRMGYQFSTVYYDEENRALTIHPSYYPGQKIVFAWKTGDFSKLTQEEQKVYEIARDLVSQAQAADPDPEAVELWLHDWICEHVNYDSPHEYVYPEDFVGLDELTCVGALRDGKANCQGYTDAFYLLGNLAGLDVCVMFGSVEEGGHCWNGVRLDGKMYLVDVTFNDTYFPEAENQTYIWYNNALDLDTYSILGGSPLFPGLVTRKDLSKTYYTRAGVVYEGINYAAFGLLREYRKNGAGVYHALIEDQDRTREELHQALINNMGLAGVYSASYFADLYTYEGDTYIWLQWI